MKSFRPRIQLFIAVAAIALAAFLLHQPTNLLGSGFSTEPAHPIAFSKSRRSLRQLWLTLPDGTRTQLSKSPVAGQAIIRSNNIVIWPERRFLMRMPFQDLHTNLIFAADQQGHHLELTPWLKTRAAKVLPTAPVASLLAISGSDPIPNDSPLRDPRVGVHGFTPDLVTLAFWRPGITFWCSVPCYGSRRPLAMQVPVEEIAELLRQQAASASEAQRPTGAPAQQWRAAWVQLPDPRNTSPGSGRKDRR